MKIVTSLHSLVKRDGPLVRTEVLYLFLFVTLSLANAGGYFSAEIAPVEVKGKKGKEMVTTDEHPRQTSLEKLSTLPTVFKDNGTVTAGNASVRKRKRKMFYFFLPPSSSLGYM